MEKIKKAELTFFLTPKSSNPDKRNIYLEVKNTTWIRENVALFPDTCLLYTSPSPRDPTKSRMPSSA